MNAHNDAMVCLAIERQGDIQVPLLRVREGGTEGEGAREGRKKSKGGGRRRGSFGGRISLPTMTGLFPYPRPESLSEQAETLYLAVASSPNQVWSTEDDGLYRARCEWA